MRYVQNISDPNSPPESNEAREVITGGEMAR